LTVHEAGTSLTILNYFTLLHGYSDKQCSTFSKCVYTLPDKILKQNNW